MEVKENYDKLCPKQFALKLVPKVLLRCPFNSKEPAKSPRF